MWQHRRQTHVIVTCEALALAPAMEAGEQAALPALALPVGLCGVLSTSSLVLGLNAASSSAASTLQLGGCSCTILRGSSGTWMEALATCAQPAFGTDCPVSVHVPAACCCRPHERRQSSGQGAAMAFAWLSPHASGMQCVGMQWRSPWHCARSPCHGQVRVIQRRKEDDLGAEKGVLAGTH